ncbi:MAG: tail fiber domain-containing protein [archaeon]|nr:tail fiber domain-containing protein [archaeon]
MGGGALAVYAYGTSSPSTFGHSASEIDGIIPASQISGVCKTDGTGCPSLSSNSAQVITTNSQQILKDLRNSLGRDLIGAYYDSADQMYHLAAVNNPFGTAQVIEVYLDGRANRARSADMCRNTGSTGVQDFCYIGNSNFGFFYASGGIRISTNFLPNSNGVFELGSPSNRWSKVYAVQGIIDTSDIQYKKNINPLNYGIDEIMKMKPVTYYWKNDSTNEGKQIGFIAQEMVKIVPEVVDGEEGSYGLNYAHLIPVLVKAIQEQEIKINILKQIICEDNPTESIC